MAALTESGLYDYIKRALGYPQVEVEIHQTQLADCVETTLETFNQYNPIRRSLVKTISGASVQLTAEEAGLGVQQVYPKVEAAGSGEVTLDINLVGVAFHDYGALDPADIVLAQQYSDVIAGITGTDFDWHWDAESLTVITNVENVGEVEIVTLHEWEIGTVPLKYRSWVRRWAVAEAKERVGFTRRKLSGVPGAQASAELDGSDLVSEGKEEKTELLEELRTMMGDRITPIRG